MKNLLLAVSICFACSVSAQTNANEAKAAYLLAEESYGKGDYKNTLEFLRAVREALGGTNCKVLYLQIMATRELYKIDTGSNNNLLSLISEFEKNPDYANFNEEKSLEISKLKLLIKADQKAVMDKLAEEKIAREKRIDSMAKVRTQSHKDYFIQTVNNKAPLNITLDELDKANPKWKIKKWVVYKVSSAVDLYHDPAFYYGEMWFPFPTMKDAYSLVSRICGVYVKDGKVIGYTELTDSYNYNTSGPDAVKYYNTRMAQQADIVTSNSQAFLLEPVTTPMVFKEATGNRYLFTEGRYGLLIEEIHAPYWGMVLKTMFYNSTDKPTGSYHPSER